MKKIDKKTLEAVNKYKNNLINKPDITRENIYELK